MKLQHFINNNMTNETPSTMSTVLTKLSNLLQFLKVCGKIKSFVESKPNYSIILTWEMRKDRNLSAQLITLLKLKYIMNDENIGKAQ